MNIKYEILVISSDKVLSSVLREAEENSNIRFTQISCLMDYKKQLHNFPSVIHAIIADCDDINFFIGDVISEKTILKQLKYLPLIAISANTEIEHRINILNSGCDDFVEKPIVLEEFLARLNAILRRAEKSSYEKIITLGGIKVDTLARKVEVNGRNVKVSAKEFGILKLFAENVNKIFSRKDILNLVWADNESTRVNERTIDVHINRLRTALGADKWGESYIRTFRGEGYSLHVEEEENRQYSENNSRMNRDFSFPSYQPDYHGGDNRQNKMKVEEFLDEFDFVS